MQYMTKSGEDNVLSVISQEALDNIMDGAEVTEDNTIQGFNTKITKGEFTMWIRKEKTDDGGSKTGSNTEVGVKGKKTRQSRAR